MLEPHEQRSFNHPLIGLYEKLKMNSGNLAFCYRYHFTELSKYFCASVVSFALPASLSVYLFLFTKISEPWSQPFASCHLAAILRLNLRVILVEIQLLILLLFNTIITCATGGGYVLASLCYEIVCLFMAFDL